MSRYRMSGGTVVDTANASLAFEERRRHDGHNWVSLATGDQWEHQKLHRSRRGRYWLECWSDWQGSTPRAEWLSNEEAARWLLLNEYEAAKFPADLAGLVEEVSE